MPSELPTQKTAMNRKTKMPGAGKNDPSNQDGSYGNENMRFLAKISGDNPGALTALITTIGMVIMGIIQWITEH